MQFRFSGVYCPHIDMVVIPTHLISGWHPLMFCTITEKIVKLVQCPLLLLRSTKPESGTKSPLDRSMDWWQRNQ
jgi:hypothetical protein